MPAAPRASLRRRPGAEARSVLFGDAARGSKRSRTDRNRLRAGRASTASGATGRNTGETRETRILEPRNRPATPRPYPSMRDRATETRMTRPGLTELSDALIGASAIAWTLGSIAAIGAALSSLAH